MMRKMLSFVLVFSVAGIAAAEDMRELLESSFKAKNQAGMERLQQTQMQRTCSGPVGMSIDSAKTAALQKAALDAIKFPADGNYLGNWKSGEEIAQTGKGMQYSDDASKPNGGNCYACHELDPAEISYGNMGPSLKQYGKLRGQSEGMLKYTWTRIWNSHAYNACSHMPRFGDAGILTEQQIKDLMALLFDPASPVNQ